jgi:hypothetical protein
MQEGKMHCAYCRRFVCKSSRHCAVCDKCVVGFDHHCRWLNTCIGTKNYPPFLAFITLTLLTLLAQLCVGAYIFVACLVDPRPFEQRLLAAYGAASVPAYLTFIFALMVYEFAATAVITHLFSFHMWLIATGRTTIGWIKEQKEEAKLRPEYANPDYRPPPRGCCVEDKRRDFKAETAEHKKDEKKDGKKADAKKNTEPFA